MSITFSQTIAILGAGWLGEPLARALAAAGHAVRVSTTTPARQVALAASGLPAFLVALEPDAGPANLLPFLSGVTVLVVSVPPGLRGAPDAAQAAAQYAARLTHLGAGLAGTAVRHVLLLSSTGVYPDLPGAPALAEAAADAAHPLVVAEQALAHALPPGVALTVARLAGLMGPGRAPGRFYGPGRAIPQPAGPVNMLHLADAIGALHALLARPDGAGVVNICAAQHPTRGAFFTAAAAALGQPAPALAVERPPGLGKRIRSERLRALTDYQFQYDDPVPALLAC